MSMKCICGIGSTCLCGTTEVNPTLSSKAEIDALNSQLQDEMIKVAGLDAVIDALKKFVALRDTSIDALKAELKASIADAERYRWFCDRFARQTFYLSEDADSVYGYQLDAAIDAAMTAPDTKGE